MRGKRIDQYTVAELDAAIDVAVLMVPRFFVVLRGIDAYMERRNRRAKQAIGTEIPFTEERHWGEK